jgi:DNA-binding winged helix-turn-helix (wHTH) protein
MTEDISQLADLETKVTDNRRFKTQAAIRFGRYVALPGARTLLRGGEPVCLGARAFDLLILLLESRGEVVSKTAIMRYVWPTTTVDESNLRFQMAELRKALGSSRDIIKTIPGRGYLLVAESSHFRPDGCHEDRTPHQTLDFDVHGQRVICDALCALLRAAGLHASALSSVDTLLSANRPNPGFNLLVNNSPAN